MAKAIITGGAVRVGKAISLALAQAGYDIILIFNNSIDEAKQLAKQVQSYNKSCHLFKCDLSKKENIDSLFADISKKFDDVTMLINNASVFEKFSFAETTEQIFDDHFDINLKAPFFLSKNFTQYVNTHPYITDANIINLLDARINSVHTGHFAYHLTKKSLRDMTLMLAKDLAPKIRVNALALGTVLPPKAKDENIDPTKFPKVKELVQKVLEIADSKQTGGIIFIDSDPELIGK